MKKIRNLKRNGYVEILISGKIMTLLRLCIQTGIMGFTALEDPFVRVFIYSLPRF